MKVIREFINLEAAGGIILMFSAVAALICANSPLAEIYNATLNTKLGVGGASLSVLLWINDALMAIFFFVIGMEIKRELVQGELSSLGQALLPALAALGGVALPALIYTFFNQGDPAAMRGWAVPTATDIAFSLAVLSLFGNRVPIALKIFLMAVAVFDDLMAIIIIALFYTQELKLGMLLLAGAGMLAMLMLGRMKVRFVSAYIFCAICMWVCVLQSGVHATVAGVVAGLCIPLALENRQGRQMLRNLEHMLHPWVAFGILPVFAFANSGISLAGISLSSLFLPVPMGIWMGLFFGKQFGIFAITWLTIRLGIAKMPPGSNWLQLYAVSMIAGIGFTMSLFIGMLAFEDASLSLYKTLGVLVGSSLSAICGYILMRLALRLKKEPA